MDLVPVGDRNTRLSYKESKLGHPDGDVWTFQILIKFKP